ncbi:lipocalin family protein [Herbaspirillum chlorophenolicum]|uniref:Outer membrane lipoprotein Blc n=1 Tax=Herbaspirillum chlorophenolicum TaxID=211589 RepID=A0ABW8F1T6_9BURK
MKISIAKAAVAMLMPLVLMAAAGAQEVKTVPSVDLKRYAGKWYEIAKIPNGFQKKCVSGTIAEYRARSDGDIDVTSRCKTADGKDEEQGLARVVGGSSNAKLQVSFMPSWLSWLPWVWSDYWVTELDAQYTLVTVGSPSRESLWILSRMPAISDEQYENAVNNATKQGFDTARLVKTRQ